MTNTLTPDERAKLLAYYERILATGTSKDRQQRARNMIAKLRADDRPTRAADARPKGSANPSGGDRGRSS